MLLSQLSGKEIICLNGKSCGRYEYALLNEQGNQVIALVGSKGCVYADEIVSVNDAVTARQSADVARGVAGVGKSAYTYTGKCLGKCTDIVITRSFAVLRFICEQKSFASTQVYAVNEVIVLKNPNKKLEQQANRIIEISHSTPTYSGSFNFLLNKRLRAPLFDRAGKLIATKGQRVTTEVIRRARSCGKLKELALKSG